MQEKQGSSTVANSLESEPPEAKVFGCEGGT